MKLLVITHPEVWSGEAGDLNTLFKDGLELLHLRKPDTPADSLRRLLDEIQPAYYSRIVQHDCFELTREYPIGGIHLNRRNPLPPAGFTGSISRSCHSLEEVRKYKSACSYVFLSPVWDSISKQNYNAAFSEKDLQEAAASGIIDKKVMALGGVTPERIPEASALHFGGVAVLGTLWKLYRSFDFFRQFARLLELCHEYPD